MSAHTPKPWIAVLNPNGLGPHLVNALEAPATVAEVSGMGTDGEANAHLIAAAPDLLEAAQQAQCGCSIAGRDSGHLVGCWMLALSEAIAKAEGKS
jgi:hypothetical protein